MPDLIDALRSLKPNAEWGWKSFDIADIEWCSEGSPPTQAELEAELVKLKAAYETQAYSRSRKLEYPPLEDFADAMYWNSKGDSSLLTAYYTACEKVKTDNPKPS